MSDKGPSGDYHGTTGDLTDGGQHLLVNGLPTKLHEGAQGKHIPQHNNYDPSKERSIFHGSMKDAQRLIDKFAGTGQPTGHQRERVDFGEIIGTYINSDTGKRFPTTQGIIHYGKHGAHIVPSKPKEENHS